MKPLLPSRQGCFLTTEGIALAILAPATGNIWLAGAAVALFAVAGHALPRLRPLAGTVGMMAALAVMAWLRVSPASTTAPGPLSAFVAVAAGLVLTFLVTLDKLHTADAREDRAGRLAILLHFIFAAAVFLGGQLGGNPSEIIAWTGALAGFLFALDLFIHSSLSWLHPGTIRRQSFFFDRSPARPATAADEITPGLAEMWLWPIIRPRLLPLMGIIALLVWACSAFHTIPPGHEGIRSRFGRFEAAPLPPGLHLSLPWPLGGVTALNVSEPRQVVLGFAADPGQPILWERAHYVGEEMSLVGGGDDFLSISVPVFYHIGNAADFVRSTAEPDRLLRDLARRALLDLTVHRRAEEIMLGSREAIRRALHQQLQAELDRVRSGLVIDDVLLRDIHPPVAVAPVFQEVVSAIEEKEAMIHESEQYRLEHLPAAQGVARDVLTKAEAAAASRRILAASQAHRLELQAQARSRSPGLYETREGYRVFDTSLAGAKKVITDDALSQGAPIHLDLRRVLNSNLIENAPPAAEPLIPDPSKRRDTFDLHVEGYR